MCGFFDTTKELFIGCQSICFISIFFKGLRWGTITRNWKTWRIFFPFLLTHIQKKSPHLHFFLLFWPNQTCVGGQNPEALDESHTEILTGSPWWGCCSWDSTKRFHLGPEQKGTDIRSAHSTPIPSLQSLISKVHSSFLWQIQYLSPNQQWKHKI